ncbi:MAG: U32 family peptidase [Ezakiella sp.]|nr:U32 family peptidase [Ezakiella sp.]
MSNIELLSPAGGIDELISAFNAGADAVYTGLKAFSARKHAKNLSLDELKLASAYAGLLKKSILLAINTILYDREIEELMTNSDEIISTNPGGIIIQDMGFFDILKNLYPSVERHASTQMTADNYYAVKNLKELGFDRVVLAREMNIDEIREIKRDIDVELEVFIHGALCVCYSGDCYFSSTIGDRSANRGDCAQPCRKKYTLIVDGEEKSEDGFFLSMKDEHSGENILQLIDACDSLKIEGRMKGKEYVFATTNYYRNIIDNGYASGDLLDDVTDAYSRGFTKGYLFNEDKNNIINESSPKHRGSLVGKTDSLNNKNIIRFNHDVHKGDGLVFLDKDENFTGIKLEDNYFKGEYISLDRSIFPLSNSDVYRNYSASLIERLKNVDQINRLPLSFKIHAKIGEALTLEASSMEKSYLYKSNYIVEKANKSSDSKSIIKEQLDRIGDSFFKEPDIYYEIDEDIFIPKSILNEARRHAISGLIKLEEINKNGKFIANKSKDRQKKKPRIYLIVDKKISKNEPYLKFIDKIGIKSLDTSIVDYYRSLGFDIYLITPSVMTKGEVENYLDFINKNNIDTVEVNNYGLLNSNLGFNIIPGLHLNIMNSYATNFYEKIGAKELYLSREMNYSEAINVRNKTNLEIILPFYQKTISMVNKAISKSVMDEFGGGKAVAIKDGKGEVFPVEKIGERYYIYNSKPLFMARRMDDIIADVISIEYDDNFNKVMDYLLGDGAIDFNYTTGHYRRGV